MHHKDKSIETKYVCLVVYWLYWEMTGKCESLDVFLSIYS